MSSPAYAAMVARMGDEAAKKHMTRIARKGGLKSSRRLRTFDEIANSGDPRDARRIAQIAREFGARPGFWKDKPIS